jgi:pyruvate kinase
MSVLEHSLISKAPELILEDVKRVKILATVGPATDSRQKIEEMFEAGVDGFRLNFSHGTPSEKERTAKLVREVSRQTGKPVSIVQDLHGPKIALSKFEGLPVSLDPGSIWKLKYNSDISRQYHQLSIEFNLSKTAQVGEPVFIADGRMKSVITKVDRQDESIEIRIINGGIVTSGKGLNLPDTDFTGMAVTEKDIEDVKFGASLGSGVIDYVALSFVQSAEDVRYFKNLLRNIDSTAKVISKIETKKSVLNLEEIIAESDGVMVARGDLAVEVGPESVPVLQRKITGLCIQHHKFVIIATQMLASMTASPEPTRAEVSDIATAVIIGADCVMLSEESAVGSYPIEAISTMKKVILYTQKNNAVEAVFNEPKKQETISEAISAAVISLGRIVGAVALVVETKSGASARHVSGHRPKRPVIAVTSESGTAQQLSIVYGIKSFIRPVEKMAATKLTNWLRRGGVLGSGDVIVTASGYYPGKVGGTDTIKVRII